MNQEKVKELEAQLASIRQQNKLLAQTVLSQNNGMDLIALQGLAPIDAKELEKKISIQLGDALIKLSATEERLSNYQGLLEDAIVQGRDYDVIKLFLINAGRAFGKIESAVKHIENFYKLVNRVPLS